MRLHNGYPSRVPCLTVLVCACLEFCWALLGDLWASVPLILFSNSASCRLVFEGLPSGRPHKPSSFSALLHCWCWVHVVEREWKTTEQHLLHTFYWIYFTSQYTAVCFYLFLLNIFFQPVYSCVFLSFFLLNIFYQPVYSCVFLSYFTEYILPASIQLCVFILLYWIYFTSQYTAVCF
jgi:hypothetical protein